MTDGRAVANSAPAAAPHADEWCHSFAAIYSYRQGCSHADAVEIARLLFSSLGELPPSAAVTTIVADPLLARAVKGNSRDLGDQG